jgi:hypothetical protein
MRLSRRVEQLLIKDRFCCLWCSYRLLWTRL